MSFDFSAFTNGFLFSLIQAGNGVASHNTDGLIHIEDPNISSDNTYSVYNKAQVDALLQDKQATLSAGNGISLSDNIVKTTGIPFGIVDNTSTSTNFTVTVPGIYKLEDGICCMVKNGVVSSVSGFTLNVNGLGAKPCYTNLAAATRDTTIFNVSYTMLFVYDSTRVSGGCWICYRGYDSNTNTLGYQLRTNNTVMPVTDTARYYKIYFTSADGTKWVPASVNSANNNNTARPVNQRPINPFGRIIVNSSDGNYPEGSELPATVIWDQYTTALGYSFNVSGGNLSLTPKAPVYLKCAPQADGSAIMDATTPIVQELPNSADGKIYILLGIAYESTRLELIINHPVYYNDGNGIRLWIGAAIPSKTSDLINDAGFITSYTETDPTVPSWAKQDNKPTYTLDEVSDGSTRKLSNYVPTNRTVNSKALSSNITLNLDDVADGSTRALANYVPYSEIISTINNFDKRKLWEYEVHNTLWAAEKRHNVTITGFKANGAGNVANLFNGSFDSLNPELDKGETGVILIEGKNDSQIWPGYVYGYLEVAFYYTNIPASVTCRVYSIYETTLGWHDVPLTNVALDSRYALYRGLNSSYPRVTKLEITINARNDVTSIVSELAYYQTRGTLEQMAMFNKSVAQTLYHPLTGTKFIVSGGTSSQFLKANGTLDSNQYITAAAIPTTVSSFTNDAGYLKSSDLKEGAFVDVDETTMTSSSTNLPTSKAVASYISGLNYATVSQIPTNVSDLNNDAGYLTQHQSIKTINNNSLIGTGNVSLDLGDHNVIESISVDGTAQTITNKNVDLHIPSDITSIDVIGSFFRGNVNGGGTITLTPANCVGQFPTISTAGTYTVRVQMISTTSSYSLNVKHGTNQYTLTSSSGVIDDTRQLTLASGDTWQGTLANAVAANTVIKIYIYIPNTIVTTVGVAAVTNNYYDLDGIPTIPNVNNATLTIKTNDSDTGDTFTANAWQNKTINLGLSNAAFKDVITAIDNANRTSTDLPTTNAVTSYITEQSFATTSQLPTKTSDLTNDSGYITISSVPTNVSDLTNDSGFITSSALTPYELKANLKQAAYKDLITEITNSNKTSANVPTTNAVTSYITSKNYITSADIPSNVSAFTNDAGYLTSHQSLAGVVASAQYNSTTKKIEFYNSSNTKLNTDIDASDFIKDGMVDTVSVTNGNLVITFNTDAGKEDISIPISSIFDASNYYTKTETGTAINNAITALNLGTASTKNYSSDMNTAANLPTTSAVTTYISNQNFATTSQLPTKVSDLTNDTGFITSSALSDYVQKVTSTDNAVVRFDGTLGAVQNSGVVIDDSNNLKVPLGSSSTFSDNPKLVVGKAWFGSNTTGGMAYGTVTGSTYTGYYTFETTAFRPVSTSDNSIDIGTSSYRWKNLYIAGKICKNATYQITVPSATGTMALTSDIPTKVSDLTNDTGFITSTSLPTKISDLTNDSGYITISSVPTKVSDLTNDSGFITSSDIPVNISSFTNDSGYITSADLPTKVSDLTNDTGFITSSALSPYELKSALKEGAYINVDETTTTSSSANLVTGKSMSAYVSSVLPTVNNATLTIQKNGTLVNTFTANASSNVTANITVPTTVAELSDASDYVTGDTLATVATSGSYNDLSNKPTIPTDTSDLTNGAGYITGYTETDPTVPSWAKQTNKPSYSLDEVSDGTTRKLSNYVPTTRKVNNQALSADVTLTLDNVANGSTRKLPTNVSDLTNDSGFITAETDPTVPSWAKAETKPTYTASEVGALPDSTVIPTPTTARSDNNYLYNGQSVDIVVDNVGISKTNNLLNTSGVTSYIALRANSSNPFLGLKEGSNLWYAQAASNYFYFGPTSTKALRLDQNGNGVFQTGSCTATGFVYKNGSMSGTSSQVLIADGNVNTLKTVNNESLLGTGNISIAGGDTNIIESISINGTAQTITNKNVDLTVPTKVSDLTNDSGFITTETDPTVPSWAKASSKPSYTLDEVTDGSTRKLSNYVLTTRKINNQSLSSDVTLTLDNVSNGSTRKLPTKVSDLTNDSGFITSSDLPSNHVTTDTNQTITGEKTISNTKLKIGSDTIKDYTFKHGQEFIVGTQVESTNIWLGDSDQNALYDGMCINYYLPFEGTSTAATLELTFEDGITTSGAIPIYHRGNTVVTNTFPAGSIIQMTYCVNKVIGDTTITGWLANSNSVTPATTVYYERMYTLGGITAGSGGIYGSQLCLRVADNRWESICKSRSNGTSKQRNTNGFYLDSIFYYSSSTTLAEDAVSATKNAYSAISMDCRYSFNCGDSTLVANKALYLVVTYNTTDSKFYLDTTWWTQTLPSTEDNKYYVYLGITSSSTALSLEINHPIWRYKSGKLEELNYPALLNSLKIAAVEAEIPTVPTNVSAFTNDAGYLVPSDISGKQNVLTAGEGIAITNDIVKTTGIPFGIVDGTSTSTAFTVTVPGIYKLEDGVCCLVKNGVITSASGFTLNVNGLGAKPCYSNMAAATRETTIFNANYTMLFVYDSTRIEDGAWICYRGYYSDANSIAYQIRGNTHTLPTTGKFVRYRLLFTSADGTKFVPSNTSTSTNATAKRDVVQTPIDPFGEIVYYSTTTAVDVGASPGATYLWTQYAVTLGYSFNRTGAALVLTFPAPVYLKCAPQSNGSAIIDADNPYVQTLPSTTDGKIYIFLGVATSATAIELLNNHPVYYHDGTGIRIWTGSAAADLSNYVPVSRTINSKALSSDVTLTLDDVTDGTNRSIPTVNNSTITIKKNSDDSGDSFTTNASSTKTINLGLATVATSGSYNDLSNKPTIPTVPSNYVTTDTTQHISGYKTFLSTLYASDSLHIDGILRQTDSAFTESDNYAEAYADSYVSQPTFYDGTSTISYMVSALNYRFILTDYEYEYDITENNAHYKGLDFTTRYNSILSNGVNPQSNVLTIANSIYYYDEVEDYSSRLEAAGTSINGQFIETPQLILGTFPDNSVYPDYESMLLPVTSRVSLEPDTDGKLHVYKSATASTAKVYGTVKANSFVKDGGSSSQFLKADGSVDDGNRYGVCDTNAATQIKTVTIPGFTLTFGTVFTVRFTDTNTVSSPQLNVNGLGAKSIYIGNSTAGQPVEAGTTNQTSWWAGETLQFIYVQLDRFYIIGRNYCLPGYDTSGYNIAETYPRYLTCTSGTGYYNCLGSNNTQNNASRYYATGLSLRISPSSTVPTFALGITHLVANILTGYAGNFGTSSYYNPSTWDNNNYISATSPGDNPIGSIRLCKYSITTDSNGFGSCTIGSVLATSANVTLSVITLNSTSVPGTISVGSNSVATSGTWRTLTPIPTVAANTTVHYIILAIRIL